jgi:ribonuclease D
MKQNRHPDYQLIDSSAGLKKMVESLETEETIAVDLEADSLYHFTERVCLIQIASEHACFIIDPLAVGSLSPLKLLFYNADI